MFWYDTPLKRRDIEEYLTQWISRETEVERASPNKLTYSEAVNRIDSLRELHQKMYRDLDSLDAKASVMSNLVAITIALQGIVAAIKTIPRPSAEHIENAAAAGDWTNGFPILFLVAFVSSMLSAGFCIYVVSVIWTKPREIADRGYHQAVMRIIKERSKRTISYRLSMFLIVTSLLIFSILTIVATGMSSDWL